MDFERLGTPARPTFGLDTFGDLERGEDGRQIGHPEAIRQVVAEAVLAEEVGLDYFGIGEHHRPDFAVSSPDVVLAAIAGKTERIRLGTGVTVLSSDDPVRVYERFARRPTGCRPGSASGVRRSRWSARRRTRCLWCWP